MHVSQIASQSHLAVEVVMKKFLTRTQIGEKLKALESQANYLFSQYGDGDELIRQFAKLSQDITSDVGPNDFEWTHERMYVILESLGDDRPGHVDMEERRAPGALSNVAIPLTQNEIHALRDVGSRVNHRLHDPALFQSLLGRGLIVASFAGGWMCTLEGRQVIAGLADPTPP